MLAMHGNIPLLGLRDNRFTWQHRAKNIWAAPKITEEMKRGGALPPHTFLCRPEDGATMLRHDQRCV